MNGNYSTELKVATAGSTPLGATPLSGLSTLALSGQQQAQPQVQVQSQEGVTAPGGPTTPTKDVKSIIAEACQAGAESILRQSYFPILIDHLARRNPSVQVNMDFLCELLSQATISPPVQQTVPMLQSYAAFNSPAAAYATVKRTPVQQPMGLMASPGMSNGMGLSGSNCMHKITRGDNKGNFCGKPVVAGTAFCHSHKASKQNPTGTPTSGFAQQGLTALTSPQGNYGNAYMNPQGPSSSGLSDLQKLGMGNLTAMPGMSTMGEAKQEGLQSMNYASGIGSGLATGGQQQISMLPPPNGLGAGTSVNFSMPQSGGLPVFNLQALTGGK